MRDCITYNRVQGKSKNPCIAVFEEEINSNLLDVITPQLERIFNNDIQKDQLSPLGLQFLKCSSKDSFWKIGATCVIGTVLEVLVPGVGIGLVAGKGIADSMCKPESLMGEIASNYRRHIMRSEAWEHFIIMIFVRYCDLY